MQQDSASFWSDIKTLDARLSENPDSLCFAQLADVYLKVGLVDDALHLARKGVKLHPRYLAGQRSLAMACHAKGLQDECRMALEQLTSAMPEDSNAQKMLARLYLQSGKTTDAMYCFKTVLEFFPDDGECLVELRSLQAPSATFEESDDINELEETDILEIDDLDIIDEEDDIPVQKIQVPADSGLRATIPSEHVDPLSTATLAELYVKQGFIDKALVIYRAVLADNPGNTEVLARIRELEPQPETGTPAPSQPPFNEQTIPTGIPTMAEPEKVPDFVISNPISAESITAPSSGSADNAVSTLTAWLENIRRIKSCR